MANIEYGNKTGTSARYLQQGSFGFFKITPHSTGYISAINVYARGASSTLYAAELYPWIWDGEGTKLAQGMTATTLPLGVGGGAAAPADWYTLEFKTSGGTNFDVYLVSGRSYFLGVRCGGLHDNSTTYQPRIYYRNGVGNLGGYALTKYQSDPAELDWPWFWDDNYNMEDPNLIGLKSLYHRMYTTSRQEAGHIKIEHIIPSYTEGIDHDLIYDVR